MPLTPPTADLTDATEALMQFLYRAPIGLAQTSLGGDIEMVNPMSATTDPICPSAWPVPAPISCAVTRPALAEVCCS